VAIEEAVRIDWPGSRWMVEMAERLRQWEQEALMSEGPEARD